MTRKKNVVPDDATVADRQRQCSRFWPQKAARSTTVPPPLRQLQPFEDLEGERSAVIAAETAYIRRRDALKRRNDQTLEDHRLAVNAAIDAGETPPAAPVLETSTDLPVETTQLPAENGQPGRVWTHNPTLERFEQKHCSIEAAEQSLMAEQSDRFKQEMPVAEARRRIEDARQELAEAQKALAPFEAAVQAIDEVAEPLRLAREKRADDRARDQARAEYDGVWHEPALHRGRSAEADALMAQAARPRSSGFSRR